MVYPIVAKVHYKDRMVDIKFPIRIKKFKTKRGDFMYCLWGPQTLSVNLHYILNRYTALRWNWYRTFRSRELSLRSFITDIQKLRIVLLTIVARPLDQKNKVSYKDNNAHSFIEIEYIGVDEKTIDQKYEEYLKNKLIKCV